MLLFLPGLICDARMFGPQLAVFSDARAVNGYGFADSLVDMARVALDEAPADEPLDLFGHSMGGRVALEVFRLAPQRVRRLALCSTGIHEVREGEPEKRAELAQIGHDNGFEALVDHWLPPMVAEGHRTPAIYEPMKAMCMDQGQERFDAQIKALVERPEVESLLPQIACPTLVITGERDGWSPPEQHRQISAAIADSELVIVPHAGHMILHEAPEAVNEAIARWLEMPAPGQI